MTEANHLASRLACSKHATKVILKPMYVICEKKSMTPIWIHYIRMSISSMQQTLGVPAVLGIVPNVENTEW